MSSLSKCYRKFLRRRNVLPSFRQKNHQNWASFSQWVVSSCCRRWRPDPKVKTLQLLERGGQINQDLDHQFRHSDAQTVMWWTHNQRQIETSWFKSLTKLSIILVYLSELLSKIRITFVGVVSKLLWVTPTQDGTFAWRESKGSVTTRCFVTNSSWMVWRMFLNDWQFLLNT